MTDDLEPSDQPFDEDPPVIDASMLDRQVDFERGMCPWPWLSILLMTACVAAFCGQLGQGALDDLDRLIGAGALHPPSVTRGEVWRLVSATFLHGGVDHLLGNLIMLYILGMACEHGYGCAQFLILYVLSGISGSLSSLAGGETSVGASGAIFGLAGGIIVLFLRHGSVIRVRDKRIGFVFLIWSIYQILLGFLTPGVDTLAHIGGFLGGAICGWVMMPAVLVGRDEVGRNPLLRLATLVPVLLLVVTAFHLFPRLFG